MIEFPAYPGEGFPIDYTTAEDSSGWTVAATIIPLAGGTALHTLSVERIDTTTWRAHVTATITTALAGTRTRIKFVATNPAVPTEPDIEQAILRVEPV